MSKLPQVAIKNDGDREYPSMVNLYDFFSPRTDSITVWSIGFGKGGIEVDIAENTGVKIKVFDARPGAKDRFDIVNRITNTHEYQNTDPEWAKNLTKHWILPESLKFESKIPFRFSGTLDISGVHTETFRSEESKIDFLKIDYDYATASILRNMLEIGYRPGVILVVWPNNPDACAITMCEAGHLQMVGYRLLGHVGNTYLYMFMNNNMYEICSWSDTKSDNPVFPEYLEQMIGLISNAKKSEE